VAWYVDFSDAAERDLDKLDKRVREQVLARIAWYAAHADTIEPVPLHAQYKGLFKLRAGDWRIAYILKPEIKFIGVKMIDHRTKIYKRIK
jgi:mRNA interferase RelE/StbE